jgi:hypothetical protein
MADDIPPPEIPQAPTVPTVPTVGKTQQNIQQQQQASKEQKQKQTQQQAQKAIKEKPIKHAYPAQLSKGKLCLFQYLFFKHDAYPMVLVSSMYRDGRVAGLNMHYLTFRYVKFLIQNYCNKGMFSYNNIRGDRYIVNAFRTYKRNGVRNVKIINCDFLLSILGQIRSFNPNEVEAIRKEVERQLGRITNQRANEVTHEKIWPKPYDEYDLAKARRDARFNPSNTIPATEEE